MKINASSFAQRFNEQPLLLSPDAVAHMEYLVRDSEHANEGEVPFDEMCAAAYGFGVTDRSKPFVFSNGIAFIPIQGVLLHKYNYSWEGATGYDYIRSRFDAAISDPAVEGIVFDVNSPGGQVAGNFELAEHIFKNRKAKKMMALVDVACYSGAYSLSSAIGRIVATPSGGAGSIGVVMMHVSYKRAYEQFGIDVNLIYAGKHKVDGSPFKELTDEARQRFQASVDRSYNEFVTLVARNRGLESEAVVATEALTYDAKEAKRIGLIDAVQEPVSALAAFRKELSGSTNSTGGNAMSTAAKPEAPTNASNETEGTNVTDTAAQPAAAVAAAPAPEAPAAAASAEVDQKARISAILKCDEAKDRRKLAEHIAFNTDMSVDAAKGMLSAAPVAKSDVSGDAFTRAMDNGEHPNMSAEAGNDNREVSAGDRIAGAYKAAKGS